MGNFNVLAIFSEYVTMILDRTSRSHSKEILYCFLLSERDFHTGHLDTAVDSLLSQLKKKCYWYW